MSAERAPAAAGASAHRPRLADLAPAALVIVVQLGVLRAPDDVSDWGQR